jgi:hypothetical protein
MSKQSGGLPYPGGLSDKELKEIDPIFLLLEVIAVEKVFIFLRIPNAIFYLLRSGRAW